MDGIIVERSFRRPKVTVELRRYDWAGPMEGRWRADSDCFLDFALTPRLAAAQGAYEDWRSFPSEPIGDIMFVPPGTTFLGRSRGGRQQALSCLLSVDFFSEIGAPGGDSGEWALRESLHVRDDDVRANLRRLTAEVQRPGLASGLLVESLAIAIAVDLARHLSRRPQAERIRRGGLAPWRRRLVEERIRLPGPPPSLAELAALCGLSLRHLARAFRAETGRPLGDYVAAAAIERAKAQLRDESVPIKRIAADLGFSSPSGFSAAFRRSTGQAPRDFRPRGRPARIS